MEYETDYVLLILKRVENWPVKLFSSQVLEAAGASGRCFACGLTLNHFKVLEQRLIE